MNSSNDYRNHAEDCLRMAQTAPDERDKPLWVTMAQSWLRLAEHADRLHLELVSDDGTSDVDHETVARSPATN